MTTYKGKLAFAGSSEDAIFRPETEAGQIVDLDDYLDTWYETKGGSGTGPGNKAWIYATSLNPSSFLSHKFPGGMTYQDVTTWESVSSFYDVDMSYITSVSSMFDFPAMTTDIDATGITIPSTANFKDVFGSQTPKVKIDISGWEINNEINTITVSTYSLYANPSSGYGAKDIVADNIIINLTKHAYVNQNEFNNISIFGAKNGGSSKNSLETISLKNAKINKLSYLLSNVTSLKTVDITGLDVSADTSGSLNGMFNNCSNLTSIVGINSINISTKSALVNMFYNCKRLTSLDLSSWDTSNVISMAYMFYNTSALSKLENITFDLTSITATSGVAQMFNGCTALGSNAVTLKFKNVPSSVFSDEAALRAAASIPSGCTVQIDNFI